MMLNNFQIGKVAAGQMSGGFFMLHLRREFSIFRSVEVGPLDNTACTCVALDAMGATMHPMRQFRVLWTLSAREKY